MASFYLNLENKIKVQDIHLHDSTFILMSPVHSALKQLFQPAGAAS